MAIKEKELIFYKIMDYPIPKQKEFFYFEKKKNIKKDINNWFSRKDKNNLLNRYIKQINKYWKLYKSLPFIKEIFLCNSITFNSINLESDIDLFIITKNNSIRRARLFSAIFFKLLWIKRSLQDKKQKFCLSFYITENNKNLYPIMIDSTDIYLWYRLAHLVPLYKEKKIIDNDIYIKNSRFKSLIPNHPQKHIINIWNEMFYWKTKFKKILEFLFWWIFWKIIEELIKIIWKPILNKKIKKLWESWKQIVINDGMLKFHRDIRKEISLLYKLSQKN